MHFALKSQFVCYLYKNIIPFGQYLHAASLSHPFVFNLSVSLYFGWVSQAAYDMILLKYTPSNSYPTQDPEIFITSESSFCESRFP